METVGWGEPDYLIQNDFKEMVTPKIVGASPSFRGREGESMFIAVRAVPTA